MQRLIPLTLVSLCGLFVAGCASPDATTGYPAQQPGVIHNMPGPSASNDQLGESADLPGWESSKQVDMPSSPPAPMPEVPRAPEPPPRATGVAPTPDELAAEMAAMKRAAEEAEAIASLPKLPPPSTPSPMPEQAPPSPAPFQPNTGLNPGSVLVEDDTPVAPGPFPGGGVVAPSPETIAAQQRALETPPPTVPVFPPRNINVVP